MAEGLRERKKRADQAVHLGRGDRGSSWSALRRGDRRGGGRDAADVSVNTVYNYFPAK